MNTLLVGIGGAGTNIVVAASQQIPDVAWFLVANTDAESLRSVKKSHPQIQTLLLGPTICRGQPNAGEFSFEHKAAIESQDSITEHLTNAEKLLVVAGLGGGAGTGATPVFVELGTKCCRSVFAVVVKPFAFEGEKRMEQAEQCIVSLKNQSDKLVVFDNEVEKNKQQEDQILEGFFDTLNSDIASKIASLLQTDHK